MSHDLMSPVAEPAEADLRDAPLLDDESSDELERAQEAAAAAQPPIRPLEGEDPSPPLPEGARGGDLAPPAPPAPRSAIAAADRRYVAIAQRHGCRTGLGRTIVRHARGFGVPISLAFALFDQESDFRKVFGHDPTIFVGAGPVTKEKYLRYLAQRKASGNRLMQGVGEGQLTWWETQDRADAEGGCWTAESNVKVSLMTLAALVRRHGYAKGIERYNGAGPAAVAYSQKLRALARVWHERLG